ncbi:hypothetical protein [uncultured Chryseobacterium sp.]|uniref:hypothetical protein n=1 Tax=uncultured Chryseobacterium sp. TaxID=259322 RepID=UPI00260126E6|nr:hypothetical protein [uncultured Chryseobacterium sp.]
MKTIKFFLSGLFVNALYRMGLTTPEFNKVYSAREAQCFHCPLRNKNFCSKNKSVKIDNNKLLLKNHPTGIVVGCGCFLPFKMASKSECPMDKWINF